jgi:hypothetical protein
VKRYIIFGIGLLLGIGIAGYNILLSYSKTQDSDTIHSNHIGYNQTGTTLVADTLYYNPNGFTLGDFQAYFLGGWYQYVDGKHLSKSNMLTYKWIILPQHLSVIASPDYLANSNEQTIAKYIQNFIVVDNKLLQENALSMQPSVLPQVNLSEQFKLQCLGSDYLVIPDFCDYNLEQFAQQAYKYDLAFDFVGLERLFKQIQESTTRNNLCQSILNYEMISWKPDGIFTSLLQSCEPSLLQTHQILIKRQDITKQLQTQLSKDLDTDAKRNQFKLVSSMQLMRSQLQDNKIDIQFLESYREFITELLKSSTTDQFTIDLIYKYHNQYLIKGLGDLQKVVNIDLGQDVANAVDKLDTLNNGDSVNTIGLRYRVSPDVVLPTDYATEHPPLGKETPAYSGQSNSGVDTSIINNLIGSVDNSIQEWLQNSGTTTTSWSQLPNQITQATGTNIPTQQTGNGEPGTGNWGEEDLNTYKPQQAPVYSPWQTNSENSIKTTISDRLLNHLGIKPDIIVVKNDRHFIERNYKNFVFSALLDKENDRKLSPIYVKIDNVRTLIPWFELYLMDYDRYSQVKFLKNPDSYVRQATQ